MERASEGRGGSTGSQQTRAPRQGDACLAKFPDQDLASQVGKTGRHELIDGRNSYPIGL